MIHRIFEYQLVDFFGRHARRDVLGQHVEAAGHQLAGLAHALECGGAVDLDLAGLAERGDGSVDVGHGPNVSPGVSGASSSLRVWIAAYFTILPPSSSAMCARIMSSNVAST